MFSVVSVATCRVDLFYFPLTSASPRMFAVLNRDGQMIYDNKWQHKCEDFTWDDPIYSHNTQQILFHLNLQTKYLFECDLQKNTTMTQMTDLRLFGEMKTWNMILK